MRMTLADAERVNRIMSDESVYPVISDDYAQPDRRYILGTLVLQNDLIYILSPNEHTLFMIIPRTMTVYEVHTMILPPGRGRPGVRAGQAAARWMFENTTCEKLIGNVPVDNKQMLLYSRLVGFTVEGICTKSWKKNGQLTDQVMFGLEKEAACQHLQQ